jgi:hypothetical protein
MRPGNNTDANPTHPNPNANPDTYAHSNTDSYPNSDTYAYTHSRPINRNASIWRHCDRPYRQ